ncbi:MAG: phosphoenolpyruvate carboxylase [Verrucomicrobiota bacterium]
MEPLQPYSSEDSFSQLADDIHQLGDGLGKVITAIEGKEVLEKVELLRQLAKASRGGDEEAERQLQAEVARLDPAEAFEMAMAFTTYFELVNLAEENCRLQILRERRAQRARQADDPDAKPPRESIEHAVAKLHAKGLSTADMQALVDRLHIELVLTAHPTEAKRRTMLTKLSRLARMLRQQHAPAEHRFSAQDALDIEYEIASLWLTDRSRTARPEVTDEIRTGLWYFDQSLWDTLPRLQRDLEDALARFYPEVKAPSRWLTFGSWIGGDRDGNPNVTPAVTATALGMHRRLALSRLETTARELSRLLSVSVRRDRISPEMEELLKESEHFSAQIEALADRYPNEPYRLLLACLCARCDSQPLNLSETLLGQKDAAGIMRAGESTHMLDTMIASLGQSRGAMLSQGGLERLRQQLETFGLHMARLDLRQHSAWHENAINELLAPKLGDRGYPDLSEAEKLELLTSLLEGDGVEQLAAKADNLSEEAEFVLGPLRVARRAQELLGPEAVGIYVISMAAELSDVLEVQFFQRWCGVTMPIAPLFETLADLDNAPGVLTLMLNHPCYHRHLDATKRHQTIMLGYSDSNKDCGYLGANWALFQAQENIIKACEGADITVTLFHGRGGSIARGGGPAAKAILAQPIGLRDGGIRVTEQGEVLSTRYHDPELAHRILEQMTYGVLLGSYEARHQKEIPAEWRAAMSSLAAAGVAAYIATVKEDPEFIEFWKQATPIDMIGQLKFGSRPAFRRATTSVADLRAIPWVFSWMQSRFNFPGWFGLGGALEAYANEHGTARLQEMYQQWPFFTTIIDNAQLTLLKADLPIARLYTGLVEDEARRERIFALIEAEYHRTREMLLAVTEQAELLENEPVLLRSVKLRNPYIDPMNYIQVEMLRRLRAGEDLPEEQRDALHGVIELTINGISHGLKNTG